MAKGSDASGSASQTPRKGVKVEAQGTEEGAGGATRPMLDLDFVKGLIEAVDGSGIDSLEITRAGTRVKISKTPPSAPGAPAYWGPPQQPAPPAPAHASAPSAAPEPGGGPEAGGGGAKAEAPKESGLLDITSPMVGTFYRAPAPEAPSYVEVGTEVSKGQTLCIIEAMKLMNELESEVGGVIKEILVENAEPVEYGQVLFRIDPSG